MLHDFTVAPIHGIELRIKAQPFSRIHAEPGGVTLEPKQDGGDLVITVPPLAIHMAVVLEN